MQSLLNISGCMHTTTHALHQIFKPCLRAFALLQWNLPFIDQLSAPLANDGERNMS